MGFLWEQLPEHLRRRFSQKTGGPEAARSFLCFAASVHDVGKASKHFAFKAYPAGRPDVADAMRSHGLDVPLRVEHPLGHAVLGQVHLADWLQRRFDAHPLRVQHFACIIGGHHGSHPVDQDLADAQSVLVEESESWHLVRDEILDCFAAHTGADGYLAEWLSSPIPVELQVLATGLVIMADWIASDEDRFSYEVPDENRVSRAMAELNLPGAWHPTDDLDPSDGLARRFPHLGPHAQPNAMQRNMVRLATEMNEPGLLLLEAPMGAGKTEGALLAAEVLARKFGLGGIFIGLPTMATSNPMFSRAKEWLDHVPCSSPATAVTLAHGKAALNDEYAAMMPRGRQVEVYDERVGIREATAIVHSWLLGRKRGMLANHVVGTIDQALFSALKAKHVALRHLGLASKVVIIDEVHAADSYMRTYLKRALTWLGRYGTPVILMSATLPPSQRTELLRAYSGGRGGSSGGDTSNGYPVIHAVGPSGMQAVAVEQDVQDSGMRLTMMSDDMPVLTSTLEQLLEEGGCAGVICNTVGRAQEAFDVLSEQLDCEVVLLHSRFLAPHRAVRERDLVKRLGRSGDSRPEKIVVVGTQVLEQSLDIDFDLLVTDLAPFDLLLQRSGRLHRHARVRPPRLASPVCLVRGVEDWASEPPTFPAACIAVYQDDPLIRAAAIVMDTETVSVPSDVPRLVDLAYDPDPRVPAEWAAAARDAAKRATGCQAEQMARAKSFLLADPRRISNLNGLVSGPALDPEDAHGYQQVRDSEDSIEVIVILRHGDGYRMPDDVGPFSGHPLGYSTPDAPLARALASCTLALPHSLSGQWVVDQVITELESSVDVSSWQLSPWLKGQLVLALSSDGVGSLAGRTIVYDHECGLIVEPDRSN